MSEELRTILRDNARLVLNHGATERLPDFWMVTEDIERVAEIAPLYLGKREILSSHIEMCVLVLERRPDSHFLPGTNKVRWAAKRFPPGGVKQGQLWTKVARPLIGIVIGHHSLVVGFHASRRWCPREEEPRVEVTAWLV